MCETLTSIPRAICLYRGLISSLHSPSTPLNHNRAALCHVQFLLPTPQKARSPRRLHRRCIWRRWVICGKWDAVALTASSAFIAASHCELLFPFTADVFFVWLRGLRGFDIFITSRGSSIVRQVSPARPPSPHSLLLLHKNTFVGRTGASCLDVTLSCTLG